jgi:protein O-mannosyl-transferase
MSGGLSKLFARLPKAHAFGVLITFAVLASIGYAPVLGSWFLADDYTIINKVSLPGGAANWEQVLSDFQGPWMGNEQGWFYRPLSTLLFTLDYFLHGTAPFGYHLTNLALHIGVSFFVFLTALDLIEGDRKHEFAFASGAIFAVHPIHPDAVTWIAGRIDVACGMFYFLALFLFLRWLRTEQRIYLILALTSFALSLMSKEMALALPAVLFICALFLKQRLVDAIVSVVPFGLVLGGYLLFRFYYIDIGLQNKFQGINKFVLLPGLVYETLQSFVPINLLLLPPGWSQLIYYALPLILVPLVGIYLLVKNDRSSLFFLLFLLVLYAVSLAPVFPTLVPDPSLARARYLYIPSAFLSMFIAYAMWSVAPRRRMWSWATTLAVCGAFLAVLIVNNNVWARASEMSQSLQESRKVPTYLPYKYKGVPVLLGPGQVRNAHGPPFSAHTDPPKHSLLDKQPQPPAETHPNTPPGRDWE